LISLLPAAAAAAAASGEGASLGGRTRARYPVEQWWLVDTVMTEWCGGGWGICQLRSCSTAAAARVIRKLSRERRSGRPESCVRSIAVGFSASAPIMSRHCCVRRSVHLCTLGVICAPVRRLGVICWAQTGRGRVSHSAHSLLARLSAWCECRVTHLILSHSGTHLVSPPSLSVVPRRLVRSQRHLLSPPILVLVRAVSAAAPHSVS